MRGMSSQPNFERSLIATLARIDTQISEAGDLLLQSLTTYDRQRVTDEIVYLQIERRNLARMLKPK
jgi:hypothetical protein